MMKRGVIFVLLGIVILSAAFTNNAIAKEFSSPEQAIGYLKELYPENIPEEDRAEAAERINNAWEVIKDSGNDGIHALKKAADTSRNDYFRLNACAILWDMRKLKESDYIAKIWSSTDLAVNYNYVFYTAIDAAKTGDPKAIPMLRAILGDKKGDTMIAMHSLNIEWPLSHEFIWGVYGSKGVKELMGILNSPPDDITLESAIVQIVKFMPLEALPKLRHYAKKGQGDVQHAAVRALGYYGHPDDYALLTNGLKIKDPEQQFHYVYALYEYQDLRAIPLIIPLLRSENEGVVYEAVATLVTLPAPEGVDALATCSTSSKNESSRKRCSSGIDYLFKKLGMNRDKYSTLDGKVKAKLFAKAIEDANKKYVLQEGDRKLKRKEFLKIVRIMKKRNRITLSKYEWIEDRHFLSVATTDDIDLLADLRASVYLRLSDECLYETRILDGLIKQLGRSGYRKSFGIVSIAGDYK